MIFHERQKMTIALNELQMWIALLALFLSTGTAIWNLLTTGNRRNARDIADLRAGLDKTAGRTDRLEQKVEGLPDREAIHRVELSIAEMAGDMREMRAGLEPIKQMAENLMAVLVDNARGRKEL